MPGSALLPLPWCSPLEPDITKPIHQKRFSTTRFSLLLAALILIAATLAGRSLSSPGLYYDEAVQARPALEFIEGRIQATPLPGSQNRWMFGRPVPLLTQPYMGALKSQALIPTLWGFGANERVLRATSLAWALAGLIVLAFWARRVYGDATALTAASLLAVDPSFLFLARHDWGSFSLSFLLRAIALFAGWRWWETRRPTPLWICAFALGLGFYNKIDFAIFVIAAAAALALCAMRPLMHALRSHPGSAVGALFAFGLGVLPLVPGLGAVASAPLALARSGEFREKLSTLQSLLDGSHFHRLMETGGLFGELSGVTNSPIGVFGVAAAASVVGLLIYCIRTRANGSHPLRLLFLPLVTLFAVAGVFALPGAVRIHHAMNIYPFPHLVVAAALVEVAAFGIAKSRRGLIALAVALGVLIAISEIQVFEQTRRAVEQSGGRGRWSERIHDLAADLRSHSGSVWSLDWGFHEPLAFLGAQGSLREVHWPHTRGSIGFEQRKRGFWRARGDASRIYVLHLPPYDRSGYGKPFLDAALSLGPERTEIKHYRDRQGETAFVTVRILDPHELTYAGRFRIALRPSN
jgi:hypothetical protein